MVKATIETKSLAWRKSQLAYVNCNTLWFLFSPRTGRIFLPKQGQGLPYCQLVGLCPVLDQKSVCKIISFAQNTQLSHRRSYRLSIRIYLNRPAPCDKWPTGKDRWSPALGKLFSENNSALWVLSVRIPGEGKWIVSQGEKTQEWRLLWELWVGWLQGRVNSRWMES